MKNKNKNLIIIFVTIITIISLLLIIVSTWFGIYASKYNGNDDSNHLIQRDISNNFLVEDAVSKTNDSNSDNISLFFVQRAGAYIVTQTLLEALLQLQLDPEKEIYIAFTYDTMPDINDGKWPRDINWELIIPEDHIVDFTKNSSEEGRRMTDEKMQIFIDDYLGGSTDRKIDLYLDSWTYHQYQTSNFVWELGNSFKYYDSITFFSDGVASFALDDEAITNIKDFDENDKLNATENINKLATGEILTEDLSDNEIKIASQYFLASNPSDLDINVLGLTSDIYKSHENILSSSDPGLKSASQMLDYSSETLLKEVVNLDEYEIIKNNTQLGKNNFVLSGNLVEDSASASYDAEIIISIYNEILTSGEYNMSDINILYKPHPRSNDVFIDEMISDVSLGIGTDASVFIQVIPKEIQFEFFLIAGEFNDDLSTNTNYQLYLTGTSTVVPAAYDLGITSEDIEKYYTTPDGLETMHYWYDGTGIIDWNKVEVQ